MKKLFPFVLFMFLSLSVFSQETRKNVVKIDLLRTLVGQYNIGYERAFSDRSSGNFTFLVTSDYKGTVEVFGFGGQFDYRYYLLKKKMAPNGLFVSPGIGIWSFSAEDSSNNSSASATAIMLQGTAGYQYIFNFGLSFDIYVGYGYSIVALESNNGESAGSSGGYPTLGLTVGYAF